MRGSRALIAVALAVTAVALMLAACGGGGEDQSRAPTSPPASEAPDGGAGPPGGGGFPPGFVECMSARGYEIQSPADIHQAPQQVLQECFGH